MTAKKSPIKLVVVQMEAFTGNKRPGDYPQSAVDGIKMIKGCGVKVLLAYHNELWKETAGNICTAAKANGITISPEYVMQDTRGGPITRKQMLQPYGVTPQQALFIGNDLTDAIAANNEGLYAFLLNGTYEAGTHDTQIKRAVRAPDELPQLRRS